MTHSYDHGADATLDRLSEAAGIAPHWTEIGGHHHVVSTDTKRAILGSMGLAADSDGEVRDSLGRLAARALRTLPPMIYAREDERTVLRVVAEAPPLGLVIRGPDGAEDRVLVDSGDVAQAVVHAPDGRTASAFDVTLPSRSTGRYTVAVDHAPDLACRLVVAPARCYLPESVRGGDKLYGIAAHLYTLRREGDGGIGDFTTLARFCEGAARHGASFVGLNPMHAMFAQYRERASPYNPSDRRFVDPIYIDVAVPEIVGEAPEIGQVLDRAAGALQALRTGAAVDYAGVWAYKKAVLDAAFRAFDERCRAQPDDADVAEFAAFVRAGGDELRRFATFEALTEAFPGQPWFRWDAALQQPDTPDVQRFAAAHAERLRYHGYLQWLADRQFAAAADRGRAAGLSLGLYRDIAVGMAPDGAEAWSAAGNYARGVSVGSPPDPFSADGQVWSLPPPNPVAEAGGEVFARLLAANMRHAGALRIDHAMGLQRLFWVPDGMRGADGTYVRYALDQNLAELALASHEARCLVIGEDLGTVPEGFRDRIAAADVLSYRVLFFERDGGRFLPPEAYPAKAVACVSTHDLPTLAGWWNSADIVERRDLGKMDHDAAERSFRERDGEKDALLGALHAPAPPDGDVAPLVEAAHAFMGRTPCALAVAQIDDLVGEPVAVNLPGTDTERPNWRRRLAPDVSTIFDGLPNGLPRRDRGRALG